MERGNSTDVCLLMNTCFSASADVCLRKKLLRFISGVSLSRRKYDLQEEKKREQFV